MKPATGNESRITYDEELVMVLRESRLFWALAPTSVYIFNRMTAV
jgi:hypothetical protein